MAAAVAAVILGAAAACAAAGAAAAPPPRSASVSGPDPAPAASTGGGLGWQLLNSTNLEHGDLPELDFGLPEAMGEAEAVAACTSFCEKTAACAAFVMVRAGPRCAIKGHATGWCQGAAATDACCVSAVKPGVLNVTKCSPGGGPTPPAPVPPRPPAAGQWRLPAIDWQASGTAGPKSSTYAVRAFDIVFWEPENKWYMYADLVLFSNPECPSSFGSEIGVFSTSSLDADWTYRGIAVPKNHTLADAGGLATPTAIVHDGQVFVYFAYEGLPVGNGLRGIGGAFSAHPLGPFARTPPAAVAPAGWHRPTGPGGIFDGVHSCRWSAILVHVM
jgi:hypothetical protein